MDKQSILTYYLQQGPMTDPRQFQPQVDRLSGDISSIAAAIDHSTLHIFWAERQGYKASEERQTEVNLRAVWQKLDRMFQLDPGDISHSRPIEKKLICNCRDITTLAVSYLRSHGIPARSRCGFGTYFIPNHFEDHWVAEFWNSKENRWQMADFQLNTFMVKQMGLTFDPLNLPAGAFVTAGEAWLMCRKNQANPDDFGIFKWHGWNFIRGNVVRDLLALNRIEILPWDGWSFNEPEIEQIPPAPWVEVGPGHNMAPEWAAAPASPWEELDQISRWLVNADDCLDELHTFYQQNPLYQPPFLNEYL